MKWHYDWLAYIEGDLTEPERSEAQAHLKECDECQKVVEQLKVAIETFSKEGERRKGCPSPEVLWSYREGKLEKSEHKKIKEHLKSCNFCQAELDSLKGVYPFQPSGVKKLIKTVASALDRVATGEPEPVFAKLAEKRRDVAVKRAEIPEIAFRLKGVKLSLLPQEGSVVANVKGDPERIKNVKLVLTDELGGQRSVQFDKPGNYTIETGGERTRISVELEEEADEA